MPDISFDEQYMWYYDEEGEYQVPDDPRDELGYEEYSKFWGGGKYYNMKYCDKQDNWIQFGERCYSPPKPGELNWVFLLIAAYIGYRIIK